MRTFLILFFSVLFLQIANAQLTKMLHQTFEVDSVDKITLNLVGEYELVEWAGNTVLTETKVEIYGASSGIFKYFIEEKGRYDIVANVDGTTASLFSKDSERQTIKNKENDKECFEFVKLKIFVPDTFVTEDSINLVRIIDSEASSID